MMNIKRIMLWFQVSDLRKKCFGVLTKKPVSYKSPRGFTLLLAVLISSVLLALGLAIFNIVSKQVILTSAGRESQFAFFAADTGIECAIYWDSQFDSFSSTSAQQISCGADRPTTTVKTYIENQSHTMTTTTSTFSFSILQGITNPCVDVKVVRSENPTRTTVEALGHNTCVTSNPRRIERAIRVQY